MEEPRPEGPHESKNPGSPGFVRVLAESMRQQGEKRPVLGRIVMSGVAVILAGAVAVGIGALVHRNGKPVDTANARRSPGTGEPGSRPPSGARPSPMPPIRETVMVPLPGGGARPQNAVATHGTNRTPAPSPSSSVRQAAANAVASVPARYIVSYASGRCIDLTNGQRSSGTPLQIWDCNGVSWQKWSFGADGTIRTQGVCMAVAWGSADGAPIVIEPCNGGPAQRFTLNQSLDLVNVAADKCVDVKDNIPNNGTRLQLWSCAGASNQKWHTA